VTALSEESRKVIAFVVKGDGEYEQVIDELREGDRILRGGSLDFLMERSKIPGAYIKIHDRAADMLSRSDVLTLGDLKVILRLLPYIRFDSGQLAYADGEPLNTADIKKVCDGIAERTVTRALVSLVECDVIGRWQRKDRRVCFFANPYIFMRGARVNKTLMKMFHKSDWAALYKE